MKICTRFRSHLGRKSVNVIRARNVWSNSCRQESSTHFTLSHFSVDLVDFEVLKKLSECFRIVMFCICILLINAVKRHRNCEYVQVHITKNLLFK
jgi:hypothetical protein